MQNKIKSKILSIIKIKIIIIIIIIASIYLKSGHLAETCASVRQARSALLQDLAIAVPG